MIYDHNNEWWVNLIVDLSKLVFGCAMLLGVVWMAWDIVNG